MKYQDIWMSKFLFDLKLAAIFILVCMLVAVVFIAVYFCRKVLARVIEKHRNNYQGNYEEEDEQ